MKMFFLAICFAYAGCHLASAQEATRDAAEIVCKQEYLDEAHRLFDQQQNGELAKNARAVLVETDSKRHKNGVRGALIGAAAAATALGTWTMTGEGWDHDPKVNIPFAVLMGGIAAGPAYAIGKSFLGKADKERETQARNYLNELARLYYIIARGYGAVISAKVVSEKEKYLPTEVAEHIANVEKFLRDYKVEMTVDQVVPKLIAGDTNKTICADNNPMDAEELAKWLTENLDRGE